jgi:error-prone DNA polymerase
MIEEALAWIRQEWGVDLDLAHLQLDDPTVYALLQRADTVGCFQVESRAQAQMLPRLKPTCFEDLVIEVALVRPGPIQGNMVIPYLKRRQGLEPVTYLHPSLESILAETLGVMVFQEQVLRVAMAVAGFSPVEADDLRRAMGRSRSHEAMSALQNRFLVGAQANGVDTATAETIYSQLSAFASYGFCKSHAAAFALVAYQTLYLKAHYAPALYCALLNHQPMGFYAPSVIAGDAKRHGVPILPVDVNVSEIKCTIEKENGVRGIRLGLCYVRGLGVAGQERLVEQRDDRPFRNLGDLCQRTSLPKSAVETLIRSGALDPFGRSRRNLLWTLGGFTYREAELDLVIPIARADLPILGKMGRLAWEVETLGLTPGDHPMCYYRVSLRRQGIWNWRELQPRRHGEIVRTAGLVIVRQRPPSAKGMVFMTLEDETGLTNLIIRPKVYRRYGTVLRNSSFVVVEGRLQREGQAISVLVYRAVAFLAR